MQVVLALHIIFVIAWFAGLFYLPRLFVYHADATDETSINRFKIMERRLFFGIMTPAGFLTAVFGFWELSYNYAWYSVQLWMHLKLILVLLLAIFHGVCGYLMHEFAQDRNRFSSTFYRWFNEIPTVFLIAIVFLVVLQKPV